MKYSEARELLHSYILVSGRGVDICWSDIRTQTSGYYTLQCHKFYLYIYNVYVYIKTFFLNLFQYCSWFIFWFFGHQACGILAPRSGIELTPSALEGELDSQRSPCNIYFKYEMNICSYDVLYYLYLVIMLL